MQDSFNIYIDRLRQGECETLNEVFSPEFIDVEEEGLCFQVPVHVLGAATFACETLVLKLTIQTALSMPCAICNESISVEMQINNFCHTEPVENISAGVFNYQQILREAIVLEIPHITECNLGNCPERKHLEKFFSKKTRPEHCLPFADLK